MSVIKGYLTTPPPQLSFYTLCSRSEEEEGACSNSQWQNKNREFSYISKLYNCKIIHLTEENN